MISLRPIPLGRAWDLIDSCIPVITRACPDLETLDVAGDLRRVEPLVTSLVLVGRTEDPAAASRAIAQSGLLSSTATRADGRIAGTHRGISIEILLARPHDYGSILCRATGSDGHLLELHRRGLTDSPYSSEDALYASLGLAYIAPELRHGSGEIEAAASGALPSLVEATEIRGDLHMHTTYSDGRDPLESWSRPATHSATSTWRSPITRQALPRRGRSPATISASSATRSTRCASAFRG